LARSIAEFVVVRATAAAAHHRLDFDVSWPLRTAAATIAVRPGRALSCTGYLPLKALTDIAKSPEKAACVNLLSQMTRLAFSFASRLPKA
jgi:hypothetical protein